jgi:ATP-dependent exoDNAse (exonuclease V) beta subunit
MVRGRIDVLLPLPQGCVIVDYKADRMGIESAIALEAAYREQLRQYGIAVERLSGHAVVRKSLVFLSERRIVDV